MGAVRLGDESPRVFAALAGVGLAAEAVHRARQGAVRLQGDGTVGHGPGAEPLDDVARGLNLVDGHGLPIRLERDHTSEVAPLVELVGDVRVLSVLIRRILPRRSLQVLDSLGVVEVSLRGHPVFLAAPVVLAGVAKSRRLSLAVGRGLARGEAHVVHGERVCGELIEPDALHARHGPLEALGDYVRVEPQRLKNLRPLVGRQGGDSHLREHLEHSVLNGVEVVVDELLERRG